MFGLYGTTLHGTRVYIPLSKDRIFVWDFSSKHYATWEAGEPLASILHVKELYQQKSDHISSVYLARCSWRVPSLDHGPRRNSLEDPPSRAVPLGQGDRWLTVPSRKRLTTILHPSVSPFRPLRELVLSSRAF